MRPIVIQIVATSNKQSGAWSLSGPQRRRPPGCTGRVRVTRRVCAEGLLAANARLARQIRFARTQQAQWGGEGETRPLTPAELGELRHEKSPQRVPMCSPYPPRPCRPKGEKTKTKTKTQYISIMQMQMGHPPVGHSSVCAMKTTHAEHGEQSVLSHTRTHRSHTHTHYVHTNVLYVHPEKRTPLRPRPHAASAPRVPGSSSALLCGCSRSLVDRTNEQS